MSSYSHLHERQIAEIDAFRAKLPEMTDGELAKACAQFIWLSAYASNNPRSAYHWMCDLTYDECSRRSRITIYERAHARLMAEARGER